MNRNTHGNRLARCGGPVDQIERVVADVITAVAEPREQRVADVGSARRGLSWVRVDGRRCDREQCTGQEGQRPPPHDEAWMSHRPTLRQSHWALPLTA